MKNPPRTKPDKPYPDFPLFPHSNGQWAKKIRGKLYYFGAWADPDAAVEFYCKVRDDLFAGRTPDLEGFLSLREMANTFLGEKKEQAKQEQISMETWKEYRRSCKRMLEILNGNLEARQLRPQDFSRLRTELVKSCKSPKTLQNELTRLKVLFRWAFESGSIDTPLQYRNAMKPPPARLLRLAKSTKGFTRSEIHQILGKAVGYMVPAIYLAINLGMGNRDVCELQWSHISNRNLSFPRPKTGIVRQAILWPETMAALETWRKNSPASKFVCCSPGGHSLVGLSNNTPIAHEFRNLMTEAKIDVDSEGQPLKSGRGFYGLRRIYRTVADEQGDQPAIMLTMGHADNSMSGTYRLKISDDRLSAIAEHVRGWFIRTAPVVSDEVA